MEAGRKRVLFYGTAAVLCVLAGLRLFAADPEIAWRESLRKVVDVGGLAVVTDTNAVTVAAAHAPVYAGQLMFGSDGAGTNAVWVAKGTATNDWLRLVLE